VHRHPDSAADACSALVKEAVEQWRVREGSYRDDITAIVVFLPFLEEAWDDEEDYEPSERTTEVPVDEQAIYLNMGLQGLTKQSRHKDSAADSLLKKGATASDDAAASKSGRTNSSEEEDFAARRLSVHNPFDEDWNEDEDEEPEGDN